MGVSKVTHVANLDGHGASVVSEEPIRQVGGLRLRRRRPTAGGDELVRRCDHGATKYTQHPVSSLLLLIQLQGT